MKVLDLTLPSPAENLACDEALLDAAEAGQSGEVLRFWESPVHFVVVGYANKVAAEVNEAACAARGIPILRRCSGGGTVVQGPGCLNYALVLRITADGPTASISAANGFIMERNRTALQSATGNQQPAITVRGYTDLALGERKFSGNAQRRRRNFLLFHGTLLLNFDLKLVRELLNMPSLQPAYREGRAHGEFMTNLEVLAAVLKCALSKAWRANGVKVEFPTELIAGLATEKYSKAEWNGKF